MLRACLEQPENDIILREPPVLARHRRIVTLKTVLIAVTAAAALLGAALIAVPSSEQGANLCLGLSKCLSF